MLLYNWQSHLTLYTNFNLRWIKDLNIKQNTICNIDTLSLVIKNQSKNKFPR